MNIDNQWITFIHKRLNLPFKQVMMTFFATFIIGFFCYGFLMSNLFTNHDNLVQLIDPMNLTSSGRWFQQTAASLSSDFSIPWINGLITLVALSLSSAFIIDTFRIKSYVLSFLFAVAFITYPALGVLMPYTGSADAYAICCLLSVISVRFTVRYKYGFIVGTVALTLSLGIYQGYFSFAAGLFIVYLIAVLLRSGMAYSHRDLWQRVGKILAVIIGSLLVYLFVTKVMYGNELSTYYGVDTMGQIPLREIPKAIGFAYKSFFTYYLANAFSYRYPWLSAWISIGMIGTVILLVQQSKPIQKDRLKIAYLIALTALLPLAVNLIYIMSWNHPVELRMIYGYTVIPVLLVTLMDNVKPFEKPFEKYVVFYLSTLIIITSWNHAITSNRAYFKLGLDYENVSAYTNRLVMQIEQTPGYHRRTKIVLFGEPIVSSEFTEMLNAPDLDQYGLPRYLAREYSFYLFPSRYLGLNNAMQIIKHEEKIEGKEEEKIYESLKTYPEKGSIKIVDKVMYVKLQELQ